MDSQHLMCPQLLSKESLLQMLQERCIELPTNIKTYDKEKLIEIYKRVAWPISQRKYNDERPLGKRMNQLRLSRQITTVNYDEAEKFCITATQDDKKKRKSNNNCGRLKPLNNNDSLQLSNKKYQFSNSNQNYPEIEEKSEQKRKSNVPMQIKSNKRQKITWP